MKNGMPSPREYKSSMIMPSKTLPRFAASINAEPKNAPTQGVQPMENTTPKTTDEKNPRS